MFWEGGRVDRSTVRLVRTELFCSNVKSEQPGSVTKALFICFETAVNSEAFINKSYNIVAVIHC
jgi:hypothetical protein